MYVLLIPKPMLLLFVIFSALGPISSVPAKLIWMDRFDALDLDTWNHLVTAWDGGNNEFQYYRNNRKNSYVKDGHLHIRPTFTVEEYGEDFLENGTIREPDCNRDPCSARSNDIEIVPPVFSARMSTSKSFSFTYGKFEVRAKMPRGDWIWPAIWLFPDNSPYGHWPTGGEIDIVEIRANKNLRNEKNEHYGIRKLTNTMHFGPSVAENKYHLTYWEKLLNGSDFSDDFHTFGLEWTNSSIKFTLDGVVTGQVTPPDGGFWELGNFGPESNNPWKTGGKMAPFDQKFHIIVNVAVGGNFFPPNWKNGARSRPWTQGSRSNKKEFWNARREWLRTWERPEMIIDHILVYGWD